jgi:hypothetical protein
LDGTEPLVVAERIDCSCPDATFEVVTPTRGRDGHDPPEPVTVTVLWATA